MTEENNTATDMEEEGYELGDTDFNLEDDYKEEPLAPQGSYNGIVKEVRYESQNAAICWIVVATQNPGMTLLDGTTQFDGTEYQFRNWLPRKGDDKVKTKSGKYTKHQWKVNALKEFADAMEVDMNTAATVKSSIEESEWIGISVLFRLGIDTYKGKTRNQVDTMIRAEEDFDLPEEDVYDE